MRLIENDVDAKMKRTVVCWANGCAGNFTAAEPRMRAFTVLAHECACCVAREATKPKLETIK